MRRFILLAPLALMACVPDPHEEVSGRAAFLQDCASCQGADGRGGGDLAEGFDPPPADLTRIAARNGGAFPRNRVMSIINGYNRGSHFSAAMPEFGAIGLGDTVVVENPDGTGTPVPERLLTLANYLERIQDL